jgi:hypothetical protein
MSKIRPSGGAAKLAKPYDAAKTHVEQFDAPVAHTTIESYRNNSDTIA